MSNNDVSNSADISASVPPPLPQPSRVVRLGEAATLALAVSLVGALPTVIRSVGAGGGFADGLLVGAAMLLWLVVPLALLQSRAARGWRGVVGKDPPAGIAVGVGLWMAYSVVLLTVLAAALKATTNHRGLGGATFGVFGAAATCLAAIAASRTVSMGRSLLARGVPRPVILGAAALIGLVPVVALTMPLVGGAATATTSATRATIFDLLLVFVLVAFAFTRAIPPRLVGKLALPALAVVVAVVAGGCLRVELSDAAQPIKQTGGLPAAVLNTLEMWTDHDGDGMGAHFGGRDCDEGNPDRRPGAVEQPGDGMDSDCDGLDEPAPAQTAATTATAAAPGSGEPAALTGSTAPPSSATGPTPPLSKPDIVLVTLDTVRADRLSLYGYGKPTTPFLTKLAERAVVFDHAYAVGSNSQRALMPIVSGRTLSSTAASTREWPRLKEEANTVAERLKAAGYATAAVTSFTWLRKDLGFNQGFDHFDESPFREHHPEREVTGPTAIAATKKVYAELAAGKAPLFVWLHLFDAHAKYLEHPGKDFGKGSSARYDGEIALIDELLKQLMDGLGSHERAKRTAWVIHGTQGEAFGEHDASGHGGTLIHDEVLRVPLLVVLPGAKGARYDKQAVSMLDVAPTVLELGGASTQGVQGVSLTKIVHGDLTFAHPPVLAYATSRTAVIDWPLKLIVKRRKDRRDRLLLFDLKADPGEQKDLSADRKADLARLNALRKD